MNTPVIYLGLYRIVSNAQEKTPVVAATGVFLIQQTEETNPQHLYPTNFQNTPELISSVAKKKPAGKYQRAVMRPPA